MRNSQRRDDFPLADVVGIGFVSACGMSVFDIGMLELGTSEVSAPSDYS